MIDKIKTYLIHFLGGYTKEEYNDIRINCYEEGYDRGKKCLARVLNKISDNNNGCSKQEWIDIIYSEIQKYR